MAGQENAGKLEQLMREMDQMQKRKVKDALQESAINRESYVHIDEDEMTAWLYLCPPLEESGSYTREAVVEYLQENNVTAGYHNSNISAMVKKKVYDREIKVAIGKPPLESRDGFYEYNFSPEQYHAPEIRDDGTVDYTSVSALQNVREGDLVATYHHAVQGESGYTVTGKELRPKTPRELPPIHGSGISNEENPDVYVALKDGKIELQGNRIDIQSVHEVTGDLDLVTGKVEFYGDVIVSGNVEAGVVIRSGRNIEIRGSVEAAYLYAGGDIILSRGIQGAKKGKISARGNIFADFIEHTTVEAGETVQANTILNSKVSAGGKVILTGKKGALLGGYTHGLTGIEATEVGNEAEIKTILHAGYEPEEYDKYLKINKQAIDVEHMLQETVMEMTEILRSVRKRGEKLTVMMENRIRQLNRQKDQYFATLDRLKKEKESLETVINKGRGAQISVEGNIYRGAVICVEEARMPVEKKTSFMRYQNVGGTVEGTVIVK